MIKRFDRLEIITSDLRDAARVYRDNFGLAVQPAASPDEAAISLGDAEIRLRAGVPVAAMLAAAGEGLGAVWLEADDVDQVAAALRTAGVAFAPLRREDDRRVLAVEPAAAQMVPLYIFDRKG
jgi:catechol 2,3-dioxygenase-like lactoylglutathione lyase family enzyme